MGQYKVTDRTSIQVDVDNVFDKTYYSNNVWFAGSCTASRAGRG